MTSLPLPRAVANRRQPSMDTRRAPRTAGGRARRLVPLALLTALATLLLACEETGERDDTSDILDQAPIYERQVDGETLDVDDTEALQELLEFDLQLPEDIPQGWTLQETLARSNERVIDLSMAHNEGEALLRLTWPVINVAGEETIEIDGIEVVQGETNGTRVYNWTSCQQSYTLQTNDDVSADSMETLISGFIDSCEDPVTPPEGA